MLHVAKVSCQCLGAPREKVLALTGYNHGGRGEVPAEVVPQNLVLRMGQILNFKHLFTGQGQILPPSCYITYVIHCTL